MAVAAETTTQVGGAGSAPVRSPWAMSASVMMPIVFCASLVPCDSDRRLALAIWPSR